MALFQIHYTGVQRQNYKNWGLVRTLRNLTVHVILSPNYSTAVSESPSVLVLRGEIKVFDAVIVLDYGWIKSGLYHPYWKNFYYGSRIHLFFKLYVQIRCELILPCKLLYSCCILFGSICNVSSVIKTTLDILRCPDRLCHHLFWVYQMKILKILWLKSKINIFGQLYLQRVCVPLFYFILSALLLKNKAEYSLF